MHVYFYLEPFFFHVCLTFSLSIYLDLLPLYPILLCISLLIMSGHYYLFIIFFFPFPGRSVSCLAALHPWLYLYLSP